MLSAQKALLRSVELLALLAALSCFCFAGWFHFHRGAEIPFEVLEIAIWVVLMLTFGPACYLTGEYAKLAKKPRSSLWHSGGLDLKEISDVIRWAPPLYKATGLLGVVAAIGMALTYDSEEQVSSQANSPNEVIRTSISMSCFFSLALPILASASRMPGSYSQQFTANDA